MQSVLRGLGLKLWRFSDWTDGIAGQILIVLLTVAIAAATGALA